MLRSLMRGNGMTATASQTGTVTSTGTTGTAHVTVTGMRTRGTTDGAVDQTHHGGTATGETGGSLDHSGWCDRSAVPPTPYTHPPPPEGFEYALLLPLPPALLSNPPPLLPCNP
eukprot:Sspe_Gene.54376::Locus_30016_Transcript_1_1_Confidence_1.000_Length_599::g.54376::m.54376